MAQPTILITGATGQLGRLVIDTLLETVAADRIAALVRPRPEPEPRVGRLEELGVETRQGETTTTSPPFSVRSGVSSGCSSSRRARSNRVRRSMAT